MKVHFFFPELGIGYLRAIAHAGEIVPVTIKESVLVMKHQLIVTTDGPLLKEIAIAKWCSENDWLLSEINTPAIIELWEYERRRVLENSL